MRKIKLCIGVMALLTAATTAIGFHKNTGKQALYYYNSEESCVHAPCQTDDRTGKACLVIVYTDSNCTHRYQGTVWTSEGN